MEVDEWVPGKTGSAHMAAPTSSRCSYRCPEATYAYPRQDQTPGSPRSIHTETHRVMPQTEALPEQTRMLSAPDLVSSLTKGMMAAAAQILEKFTCPPPVDDVVDATIWEHLQERRAVTTWVIPAGMESSAGQVSAFN